MRGAAVARSERQFLSLVVLLLLALLGCTEEAECVPQSCGSRGANCGQVPDECGITLQCGTCSEPETCGGGGRPNVCGCTRTSCLAEGIDEGSIPDGCGGTLDCDPPPTLTRGSEPVSMSVAALPQLIGTPVTAVRLYAWVGGAFEPIRSQVDERVNRTFDYDLAGLAINSPELSYVFDSWGTTLAVADDGLPDELDADDEISFLAGDAGTAASLSAWVEGADPARYALTLEDPVDGGSGVIYLFTFTQQPAPAVHGSEVAYDRNPATEETTVTTPAYAMHYDALWSIDELRLIGQPDLIDRLKGRAYHLDAASGETEETWDDWSRYVGDRSGPVRTLREVLGAASGVTTTYIAEMYPDRIILTTYLRVHAISGVYSYVDYDSSLGEMSYLDSELAEPVSIDGQADVVGQQLRTWVQVTTNAGSLVHLYEVLDAPPLLGGVDTDLEYFYVDDAAGAAGGIGDGTGDDQPAAWGNHGMRIVDLCVPHQGALARCADNDPAAQVCCIWSSPYGDVGTGSYFHPLVFRHTIIPVAPGDPVDGAQYRLWLDEPLEIQVTPETRP